MEEQQLESPTVATQTEPVIVCHQGTSVNELLIATGGALLTTERIRIKCHSIRYGKASRYVPAASDEEDQPGISTQTEKKTECVKFTQTFSNTNIGFNGAGFAQSKRAVRRAQSKKLKKSKAAHQAPSGTNIGPDGRLAARGKKRAKRLRKKIFRQLTQINNSLRSMAAEAGTLNYIPNN